MLSVSLALLLPSAAGFCPQGSFASRTISVVRVDAPIVCRSAGESISRRDFAAVAAGFALLPQQAFAESTLVTRQQSYTRYVPRVERGRDYWSGGLRKLIAAGDWKGIDEALQKKGSIDRIFGPMELWSSSFSGKTISAKTLAMNDSIDQLREAVSDLRAAVAGKEGGGGFFGFGGAKAMDENKRKQLANSAYQKGVDAINKYIELGNDGLGLNFTPVDTID